MTEDDCDHTESTDLGDCLNCGGYLGVECMACGHWYDGGDHVAATANYCHCDHPKSAIDRFADCL